MPQTVCSDVKCIKEIWLMVNYKNITSPIYMNLSQASQNGHRILFYFASYCHIASNLVTSFSESLVKISL